MAMTYAELLQKYDLLRAVAEAAERLRQWYFEHEASLSSNREQGAHLMRALANALAAAKDGGAL